MTNPDIQVTKIGMPTTTTTTIDASTTTTIAGDCIDVDGDGYGENCAAGPDCNDNDPDLHEGCPDCTVRIIPAAIGWFMGDKEKTRFLLAMGSREAAFDGSTPVIWDSAAIETLDRWAFLKRFLLIKVSVDAAALEKGDIAVSVGGCTGKIKMAR